MKTLTLKDIKNKIKTLNFPKFDLIVAIGRDGIQPAKILSHFLKIPVKVLYLNYRDKNNKPVRKEPILIKPSKIKDFWGSKMSEKQSFSEHTPKSMILDDSENFLEPLNKNIKSLKNKKILLVDTISRTGKTLNKAKELLNKNKIKTFVINGKADYSLFNYKGCIEWPW